MKRTLFWRGTLPTMALLTVAARPALALWIEVTLTKNGVYDAQQFTITTQDEEHFKRFEVRIAPQGKPVSPFLTGQLSLIAQDAWVASVPVSEKWQNGSVTYTFRVAPDAIAQSTFELHASAYAPAGKERGLFGTALIGKQKVEQVMGGIIYKWKLKDFASTQAH